MTTNGLLIYSYIRKPFLIYDLATVPLWISLYMRKIWFSFLSVQADILHNFQNGCHNVHQYLLGPQDCIKSDQWKYISTVLEFILSAINFKLTKLSYSVFNWYSRNLYLLCRFCHLRT
jgi:hypothetical protein